MAHTGGLALGAARAAGRGDHKFTYKMEFGERRLGHWNFTFDAIFPLGSHSNAVFPLGAHTLPTPNMGQQAPTFLWCWEGGKLKLEPPTPPGAERVRRQPDARRRGAERSQPRRVRARLSWLFRFEASFNMGLSFLRVPLFGCLLKGNKGNPPFWVP